MRHPLPCLIFLILAAAQSIPCKAADQRPPWTDSRVKGSPYPPPAFDVRPVFPEIPFQSPTSIEAMPGSSRLVITEIGGKIYSIDKKAAAPQKDLFLDLVTVTGGSATAFDTEFDPDFHRNRHIFVSFVHPGNGGHSRVSRFEVSTGTPSKINPKTETVIITWPNGGHNGGCLEFGHQGHLFISTGDGSGPNPPDALTTGQTVDDLLGAILRLDVRGSSADQPYRIPPDNPFVGRPDARAELWAYGFRNPWKIGVDRESDAVYAADNGWETWEIVHKIVPGGNGGWPVMEGRDPLRTDVPLGPTPIVPPFKDHPHTEANSVIGGPVYRGERYPDLNGWFIYGDYITGTIWAVTENEDKSAAFQTLCDTDLRIVSLTQGEEGEVYLIDYDTTQQIYEMVVSDSSGRSAHDTFPNQLSKTGIFRSLETLEPMPGVVPYQVTVPRWMDGAKGKRWIAIPGQGQAKLSLEEPSEFPEGTVLVKQIELSSAHSSNPIRLETQLLHLENDTWTPYSYLWNEDGTDASLTQPTGVDRDLPTASPADQRLMESWHVGAQNECRLCHNADAGYVLGFSPNQLQSQLESLSRRGVIHPTTEVAARHRLVDPQDKTKSLNDRARSYLHANCAMCHRPGGSVIASFFLRRDLSFEALNTNKGTGVGTFGIRNAKVIANGDPFRSVVLYRMSKLGYSRMPYIGTQSVDSDGVALIADWIRSLPPRDEDAIQQTSAPLTRTSLEARAIAQLKAPDTASQNDRQQAFQTLTQSTEGALALTSLLHRGALPAQDRATAAAVGMASPETNIQGLFETFLPESARRVRLGSNIDPNRILKLNGDAVRGRAIFFGGSALCKNCHHPEDPVQSIGTTLQAIRQKYPQKSELLRHILEPSLVVEDSFATYTVETSDGVRVNGQIVRRTQEELIIRTAELDEYSFRTEDILSRTKNALSPMPSGVLSDLTAQQAADLLAFLANTKS